MVAPQTAAWGDIPQRQGSQYCSHEFQRALKDWGMRSSMSRKCNCWDNAPTESFWGRLKTAVDPLQCSAAAAKNMMPMWRSVEESSEVFA